MESALRPCVLLILRLYGNGDSRRGVLQDAVDIALVCRVRADRLEIGHANADENSPCFSSEVLLHQPWPLLTTVRHLFCSIQ